MEVWRCAVGVRRRGGITPTPLLLFLLDYACRGGARGGGGAGGGGGSGHRTEQGAMSRRVYGCVVVDRNGVRRFDEGAAT